MKHIEVLNNLGTIINNQENQNVYNIFKTTEQFIRNNDCIIKIEPKINRLLEGMYFSIDEDGKYKFIFGQKYIDTYKKDCTLHHTIFLHELTHLYDAMKDKEKFFKSKIKEKYWHEFRAKEVEIEFIKCYLAGKYNLSKFEEFLLESYEKDDMEGYFFHFSRISKHIYKLFRDIEKEYNSKIISVDEIIYHIATVGTEIIKEYYKSKNEKEKFENYVIVKSYRNCIEDIELNNNEKEIGFKDILKIFPIEKIHYGLYKILNNDEIFYRKYGYVLNNYLEENFMNFRRQYY